MSLNICAAGLKKTSYHNHAASDEPSQLDVQAETSAGYKRHEKHLNKGGLTCSLE